jgi:hypothetical protein
LLPNLILQINDSSVGKRRDRGTEPCRRIVPKSNIGVISWSTMNFQMEKPKKRLKPRQKQNSFSFIQNELVSCGKTSVWKILQNIFLGLSFIFYVIRVRLLVVFGFAQWFFSRSFSFSLCSMLQTFMFRLWYYCHLAGSIKLLYEFLCFGFCTNLHKNGHNHNHF